MSSRSDTYNLLKHLPRKQRENILRNQPEYMDQLEAQFLANVKIIMNTPPDRLMKLGEIQRNQQEFNRINNV